MTPQESKDTGPHPPPSSATPPPSSSKKRLLSAHPKPKTGPNNRPDPPTIPSDDQLLFPEKKTRDLPNLSDCHCCGLRINHTNPKDRLQILDSVWRIVLLCRKCFKRVELGQTCPYCFKESASSECWKCRDCDRKIHKQCVVEYGVLSPWSFCRSELGLGSDWFSICIDCWLPKVFRKSIRIFRRKRIVKAHSKFYRYGSRGASNAGKGLEGVGKDANCLARREVVLALMAQPKAMRKAGVARNAQDLANGGKDLVKKKDKVGKKSDGLARSNSVSNAKCREDTSVTRAVDDADLAFQLHRSINSSPRISRKSSMPNASCLNVPRTGDESGSGDGVGEPKPRLQTYRRRSAKKVLKTYQRGLKRKIILENLEVDLSAKAAEKCDVGDDRKIITDSCSSEPDDLIKHEHLNENRCTSSVKCEHDGKGQTSNEKPDRFLLKYSKRQQAVSHD